jgi:hypothetical protein
MITTFDQRERAFETKFALDEELRFKTNARRNRLLGLWAGRKLGLAGADADSYARALVTVGVDNPGSDRVFEKVKMDLARRDIIQPDEEIRWMMEEFTMRALAEIGVGR